MQNRVCHLFGIRYPIIQGGMVWCSGWRLASAVSNAGGLGLLGAGSMHPGTLREHIRKCKAATDQPFGVNVPLMYPEIETLMEIIQEEGVKIVFTSAGNPKTWTSKLQQAGIKVAHVVSSSRFAMKCEEAGVDAIVAEGFEAGGHNGREETTTFCLIPAVKKVCSVPLIAAGGIVSGEGILAAEALGAEGVQMGTRFALTEESSAHFNFKDRCLRLNEGDTLLTLKQLSPTRLVKNDFYKQIEEAEQKGASADELKALLGKGRAKKGIFEGDLYEGELEIGQAASQLRKLQTVDEVMKELVEDYRTALRQMEKLGAKKARMVAKIAGGATMFTFQGKNDMMQVGDRNVEAVKKKLKEISIPILAQDTGKNYGRTVTFYPETGEFHIRAVGKSESII